MQQVKDIRIPSGGLNSDDDDILIPQTDYRDARNWDAVGNSFHNLRGCESALNYAVNARFQFSAGTSRTIGVAEDEKNNALIYFLYNSLSNHCIIRMYKSDFSMEYILKDQPILNFSIQKQYRINNPVVIDNLLIWTDNYNPPRKINIDKAKNFTDNPYVCSFQRIVNAKWWNTIYDNRIALLFENRVDASMLAVGDAIVVECSTVVYKEHTGDATVYAVEDFGTNRRLVVLDRYWQGDDESVLNTGYVYRFNVSGQYYGLTEQVITRIKYPSVIPPTSSYDTDDSRKNNLLKQKYFTFKVRYVYDDDERSVWSPESKVLLADDEEFEFGYNRKDYNKNNRINIWYWTGSQEVKRIEIAFRVHTLENWMLLERVEKYDSNGNSILKSNVYHQAYFYNDIDGEGIDQADMARPFDNVPEKCGASAVFQGPRIIDGDITEGKDNVEISVSLTPEYPATSYGGTFNCMVRHYEIGTYTVWRKPDENKVNVCYGEISHFIDDSGIASLGMNLSRTMWVIQYTISASRDPESSTNPYTRFSFSYFPFDTDTITDILTNLAFTTNKYAAKRVKCYFPPRTNAPNFQINFYTTADQIEYYQNYNHCFLYPQYVVQDTGNEPELGEEDSPKWFLHGVKIYAYSIAEKYPSYKYNSTVYSGIVYYDEAGRFGGVNKSDSSKLFVPSLWEVNNGQQSFYDPGLEFPHYVKIKYSVKHLPPPWAKYWGWAVAKKAPVFRYGIARAFSIYEGKTYFNVDSFFMDFVEDDPQGSVKTYFFQKGDRIRFLAGKYDKGPNNIMPSFDIFYNDLDFEIIGEKYNMPDQDVQKKYDDGTYLVDEIGNRVYDPYYRKLWVSGFDCKEFNITENPWEMVDGFSGYSGYSGSNGDVYFDPIYIDQTSSAQRVYTEVLVEIYTPNQNLSNNDDTVLYYETGQIYEVGNPGTSTAYHKGELTDQNPLDPDDSPATGYIHAEDVYVRLRVYKDGQYQLPIEDVHYSDFFESNVHNRGRINKVIYDAKNFRYKSKWQFGGVYYENTQVNNLFRIDPADFGVLTEQDGAITGFRQIGGTLKVFQQYKRTSYYVNKVGLMQAGGEGEVVATTNSILSDKNPSEDNFGCQDPESILVVDRSVVFYDRNNGVYVRDFSNGQSILSAKKTVNLFQQIKGQIDDSIGDVMICSGYDAFYGRIYFLAYGVDQQNTPGYLDALNFHIERDRWLSHCDFQNISGVAAECFFGIGNLFVGFFNGVPWIFNQSFRTKFFGTKWKHKIKFVFNVAPADEKIWESIAITSNKRWSAPDNWDVYIPANETYVNGMCSRLKEGQFEIVRGTQYADFLRNMITNSNVPTVSDLINGDFLDGHVLHVQIQNEEEDEVQLKTVVVTANKK